MTSAQANSPGRPPKAPQDRRDNFSIRIVPNLRAELQRSADAANRSLCAEIEFRLDASMKASAAASVDKALSDCLGAIAPDNTLWRAANQLRVQLNTVEADNLLSLTLSDFNSILGLWSELAQAVCDALDARDGQ